MYAGQRDGVPDGAGLFGGRCLRRCSSFCASGDPGGIRLRSRAWASWSSRRSRFLTGFDVDKSDTNEGFMGGNSSKLVNNINFIPNEFQNPNSYYGSGIGGPDLSYAD